MKLPAIDPLLQNFHKNLLLDPLLKHEADELIEIIEYDNFNEIRIQFLEKIDFSIFYNVSSIGNDAMFQKKYYLYYTQKEQSLELCFVNNKIKLCKDIYKEPKFKEILKSINGLSDIKLINKLFGTHFNSTIKVYF